MKEWILQNLDISVITSALTSLGSLAAAIVCLVKTRKAKKVLKDAQSRMTQGICPKCHKKSPINEFHWELPGGLRDDNLNGVPDDQE